MVVPCRDGSRGNTTCVVRMAEEQDLGTRHRPVQNATGNTSAEKCWAARRAVIVEHQPCKRGVLELNCANYFFV